MNLIFLVFVIKGEGVNIIGGPVLCDILKFIYIIFLPILKILFV